MNISKNINKITNILVHICLLSILIILSKDSLIFLLSIPIVLKAYRLNYDKGGFLIVLLGAILTAFVFLDIKSLGLILVPTLLLTLILNFLSESKLSDKNQIIVSFILASLVMVGVYRYEMISQGLDTKTLALELKEAFSENYLDYELSDRAFDLSVSLYPAILSTLAFIYSLVSLKLIRNYMAYKKLGSDMVNLNTLRISRNGFFIIIAISIVSYLLLPSVLNVGVDVVLANIIWLIGMLLFFNGLSTYQYIANNRRSKLTRGLQWFFIIILFYFYVFLFIIIGLIDIFMNLRKRTRRQIYGQK